MEIYCFQVLLQPSIPISIYPYIHTHKKKKSAISSFIPFHFIYFYISMDVYISYVLIRTAKREIHLFLHFSYCTYSICCPVSLGGGWWVYFERSIYPINHIKNVRTGQVNYFSTLYRSNYHQHQVRIF